MAMLPRPSVILYALYLGNGELKFEKLCKRVKEFQEKLPLDERYSFDTYLKAKFVDVDPDSPEFLDKIREITVPYSAELDEDVVLLSTWNLVEIDDSYCPEEYTSFYECNNVIIRLTEKGREIVERKILPLVGKIS